MRKLSVILVVLMMSGVAGAATIKVKSEKWGDVNFPHRPHVLKAKLTCGACHVTDSQNDMLTKKGHGPCKGCHVERSGPVFCQDCHPRRK